MALPESIRKAAKDREYTRHFGMKLNMHTDADLIAAILAQKSFQGYIKALIRADVEKNGVPELGRQRFETILKGE